MRFDVTVPTPGAFAQHRGITPDAVAELVDHAAAHGLRLSIRPHQPLPDVQDTEVAVEGPA